MRKYLFVCLEGMMRSPNAASVSLEIAHEKGIEIIAGYWGINAGVTSMSDGKLQELRSYGRVIAMEPFIADKFSELIGVERSKIECLEIPDDYIAKEQIPELRRVLKSRLINLI